MIISATDRHRGKIVFALSHVLVHYKRKNKKDCETNFSYSLV